jgi:hypothetical protein
MKGPSRRLKFDVRRIWQCHDCGRKEYTSGKEVVRACPICSSDDRKKWMRLVEGRPTAPDGLVDPPTALS